MVNISVSSYIVHALPRGIFPLILDSGVQRLNHVPNAPDIRNARLRKKKQGGIPCRERIRKIFPCLLLGLIYFVKVK